MSLDYRVADWLTSFTIKGKVHNVGKTYTANSAAELTEMLSERDEMGRPYLLTVEEEPAAEDDPQAEGEETPPAGVDGGTPVKGGKGGKGGKKAEAPVPPAPDTPAPAAEAPAGEDAVAGVQV